MVGVLITLFYLSLSSHADELGRYLKLLENPELLILKNSDLTCHEVTLASSQDPLCSRNYREYLLDPDNLLSFTNADAESLDPATQKLVRDKSKAGSGIFGVGYCWWHSKLTLNSAIVASFNDPSGLEIRSDNEAQEVVRKIRDGELVRIKNFKNLKAFGTRYEQVIRKELNRWQVSDTLKGKWVQGLKGKSELKNQELEKKIQQDYEAFQQNPVPRFQLLQEAGVTAHSWLVLDIKKVENREGDDYEYTVVDSSFPIPVKTTFMSKTLQSSLIYHPDSFSVQSVPDDRLRKIYQENNHSFVPYSVQSADEARDEMISRIQTQCSPNRKSN